MASNSLIRYLCKKGHKHRSKIGALRCHWCKQGYVPWNKGENKFTNEIVKRIGENESKTKKLKIIVPWNKGKVNIFSKRQLQLFSRIRKGGIPVNKGISKYKLTLFICKGCQKSFKAVNNKNWKYCSRDCYLRNFIPHNKGKRTSKRNKYPPEFSPKVKKFIRELYENKCLICDARELLQIHHLDSDIFSNFFENLVPLCASCHKKIRHNLCAFEQLEDKKYEFFEWDSPEKLAKLEESFKKFKSGVHR
jgi:hypothetical protein